MAEAPGESDDGEYDQVGEPRESLLVAAMIRKRGGEDSTSN